MTRNEEMIMWKLVVGFMLFAGIAMFVLMRSGGDIDMSGEKHGSEVSHEPAAPAAASSVAK